MERLKRTMSLEVGFCCESLCSEAIISAKSSECSGTFHLATRARMSSLRAASSVRRRPVLRRFIVCLFHYIGRAGHMLTIYFVGAVSGGFDGITEFSEL